MPKSYQSQVINAPISTVWETIKNFHDMSWGPSIVKSCEKVGDIDGENIGAKRILNGVFKETLQHVDATNYTIHYSIDEGVSPVSSDEVSNYLGEITLFQITQTNETFIEWKSSWKSKSDEAEEFCHTLYVALMQDLNSTLSK